MDMITETFRETTQDVTKSMTSFLGFGKKRASAKGPVYQKVSDRYKTSPTPTDTESQPVQPRTGKTGRNVSNAARASTTAEIFDGKCTSASTGVTTARVNSTKQVPQKNEPKSTGYMDRARSFVGASPRPVEQPANRAPVGDDLRAQMRKRREQEHQARIKAANAFASEHPSLPKQPVRLFLVRPQERKNVLYLEDKHFKWLDAHLDLFKPENKWVKLEKFGFRASTTKGFRAAYTKVEKEVMEFEEQHAELMKTISSTSRRIAEKQVQTDLFLDKAQDAMTDMKYRLGVMRYMRCALHQPPNRDQPQGWEPFWAKGKRLLDLTLDLCDMLPELRDAADADMFELNQLVIQAYQLRARGDKIEESFNAIYDKWWKKDHLMDRYMMPVYTHFSGLRELFLESGAWRVFSDLNRILYQSSLDNCQAHAHMNTVAQTKELVEYVVSQCDQELAYYKQPWKP